MYSTGWTVFCRCAGKGLRFIDPRTIPPTSKDALINISAWLLKGFVVHAIGCSIFLASMFAAKNFHNFFTSSSATSIVAELENLVFRN